VRRSTSRRPLSDFSVSGATELEKLLEAMGRSGGFMSAYVARAAQILEEMVADRECVRWFSFVGALAATGVRGVLTSLIRRGFFDYVVTTCGALDHDIARSLGEYYEGYFEEDDAELLGEGLHRLGSVIIPEERYGVAIESFMRELLQDLYLRGIKDIGSVELCREIGLRLGKGSFLRAAAERGAKVIVPGIMDGAVGTQLWIFHTQHRDFRLNLFRDYDILADTLFKNTRRGALMVGGGISKHHTLWLNQFGGGLHYAVYITTGVEWDGSLTGAPLREAISWRKLKADAKKITVYGDATVLLPLLAAKLLNKERGPY
jgi:deoxyhypusine synthase